MDSSAIVYTGGFYPPKSTARPLMRALKRLLENRPDRSWRFHYYGPDVLHVQTAAVEQGVQDRVVLHGAVSRAESLAATRGAGAATIVVWDNETGETADRGIITGKIFEPIGMGTPVLVVAPRGFDVEDVVRVAGNEKVFSASEIDGMASYLGDLMDGSPVRSRAPETHRWNSLVAMVDRMLRATLESTRATSD